MRRGRLSGASVREDEVDTSDVVIGDAEVFRMACDLTDMRDLLVTYAVATANTYGKTSRPARAAHKAYHAIDEARWELENKMVLGTWQSYRAHVHRRDRHPFGRPRAAQGGEV